jgi:hypothetical protein
MKHTYEVKSHSHQVADTGEYDGYWEIVNERGDSIRTTEDYEGIEEDLKTVADLFNKLYDVSIETATEVNVYCENERLKSEAEQSLLLYNNMTATIAKRDEEIERLKIKIYKLQHNL